MKNKIKFLMFAILVTLLFNRCGKEEPPADGKVVFWMRGTVVTNGTVDVTINGVTQSITLRYASGVSCTTSGCAIFSLKDGTYSWVAEDQFPIQYQLTGNVTSKSGTCTPFQLQ